MKLSPEEQAALKKILAGSQEDNTTDPPKEDKPTTDPKEDKSKNQLELEAQMAELQKKLNDEKAKNTKRESWLQKIKKSLSGEGDENDPQDPKEPEDKPKGNYVTKEEFEQVQEHLAIQQTERMMDDCGVPRDAQSRTVFMALLSQKQQEAGTEDVSDEDLQKILETVNALNPKKGKKAKKEKDDDDDDDEENKEDKEDQTEEEKLLERLAEIREKKSGGGTGKRLANQKKSVDLTTEEKAPKHLSLIHI